MLKSIRFAVHYGTQPNQNLVLVGGSHLLGDWDLKRGLRLGHLGSGQWMLEVILPNAFNAEELEYKYVLVDDHHDVTFWEAGPNRVLSIKHSVVQNGVIELRDTFQAGNLPEYTWLDTTLFEDVVFLREEPETVPSVATHFGTTMSIELRVLAQAVEPEQVVYVVGNLPELGAWNPYKSHAMSYIGKSTWALNIQASSVLRSFEYKYLIGPAAINANGTTVVPVPARKVDWQWEEGSNRLFNAPGECPFKTSIGKTPSEPGCVKTNEIFRRKHQWRASGVAVPVFSLRTSEGSGVGEFLDLKAMVDFCERIGSRMIQILPVNDTSCFLSWRDSYPYSSLSVFALHPLYLRLQRLTQDPAVLARIEAKAKELNELSQIDYEAVMANKNAFIKEIYETEGVKYDKKAVNAFVEANKEWLIPYAVFVSLRDRFGTAEYMSWSEESLRKPSRAQVFALYETLVEDAKSGVACATWVQYHLHEQLLEASQYAARHRVGLKGDLPIGVNRVSVDSWLNHDLFHMSMSTGAPPDQFSEDGQNWGFPTYDWEKMAEDNYAWWRQRLTQMAQYFHAFRIDHILGFFRIWEIPVQFSSGMMGHYNPSIAIHRHQLERAGVWDIRRLVEPHIRFDLIASAAGMTSQEAQHLVDRCFDVIGHDRYALKPEIAASDSQLQAYLDSLPDDTQASAAWKQKVQKTLTAMQKNVVLLPHPTDPDLFYPRVNFATASAFKELPAEWRTQLYHLYVQYFYGAEQEEHWRKIGAARLPVIRAATRMLVCGEDLGMVPKCVEPVMSGLGILGLRVQRMPADPKITFGTPAHYEHLTVCTTSSHDTSTIRGWWEEDRAKTTEFWNSVLHENGQAPWFCEPWIAEKILSQHFHSPSMLAIFPIQDFFAMDENLRVADPASEKINEPSNPKHYWRYRLHIPLEDLLKNNQFIDRIQAFNISSGRN
jgi:4-alpha-glucanotransferase